MSRSPQVDDADPEAGVPYLRAASWWLAGAGVLLLLPRQWASSGIALALAVVLHMWQLSRSPDKDERPAPPADPDDG